MYCPVCFNDTLKLKSSGVIQLIINGKQMDAGRFLYSTGEQRSEMVNQARRKIEDFFKWYSNFKNQEPIQKVQMLCGDITCDSGCRIPLGIKVSVVGILFTTEEVRQTLDQMAKKYNMVIELVQEA